MQFGLAPLLRLLAWISIALFARQEAGLLGAVIFSLVVLWFELLWSDFKHAREYAKVSVLIAVTGMLVGGAALVAFLLNEKILIADLPRLAVGFLLIGLFAGLLASLCHRWIFGAFRRIQ